MRKTQFEKKPFDKKRANASYSPSDHFVCGRNAVREVLQHRSELVVDLLCTAAAKEELSKEGAIPEGTLLQIRSGKELDYLLHTSSHQGVCARMSASSETDFDELCSDDALAKSPVYLALDGIQDPHNLGALFRAAECFGIAAIIWSHNRTVSITPAVTKVSVGATELVAHSKVGNLSQAMKRLKEKGVWLLAAANGPNAKIPSEVDLPGPKCLILGSEGEGIAHALQELADLEVFIPMQGKIDSLNVSQAGAIILSQLAR